MFSNEEGFTNYCANIEAQCFGEHCVLAGDLQDGLNQFCIIRKFGPKFESAL